MPRRPIFCHIILSLKSLRHFPRRIIGFVFSNVPCRRSSGFTLILPFPFLLLPYPAIGFVFSNWVFNPPSIWGLNKIGFVWVCFLLLKTARNHQNLHKSLLLLTLCHFAHINIGFVFSNHPSGETPNLLSFFLLPFYFYLSFKLALFFQIAPPGNQGID